MFHQIACLLRDYKLATVQQKDLKKKRWVQSGGGSGGMHMHWIPWFARRQLLWLFSTQAQWALYRGANQPCQAVACLIKGQEREALSANDWGGRGDKTYSVLDWTAGRWPLFFFYFLCTFFRVCIGRECQCLTQCFCRRLSWLIQPEVRELSESQYQTQACVQAFRLKETRQCEDKHT